MRMKVRGGTIILDASDVALVQSLSGVHVNANGYAVGDIKVGKKWKRFRIHRLLMNAKAGEEVDHINRRRSDNRRINLRICTVGENRRNCKMKRNNTSGYRGVSSFKRDGSYEAYITENKKKTRLGYFATAAAAAIAFNEAAIKRDGKYALLNVIK